MGRNQRYSRIVDDSLEVLASEIEDLENDELSPGEAGFLFGYEENEEDGWRMAEAAAAEA